MNGIIQDKLREEVLSKLMGDGQLTYEALEDMTYLQQVVDGEDLFFKVMF